MERTRERIPSYIHDAKDAKTPLRGRFLIGTTPWLEADTAPFFLPGIVQSQ